MRCPDWLRSVPNYEGKYWVTRSGEILNSKGASLKKHDNGNGYLVVILSKQNKKKHHRVHRIVANAFLQNPESLPEVNHKDENKQNNRAENLEWCTSSYNKRYGSGRLTRSEGMKRVWAQRRAANGKQV